MEVVHGSDRAGGKVSSTFPTTRWSLIYAVRGGDERTKDEALTEIYRKYRNPLYVFVRAQGSRHEEAEDVVQAFFAMLLRREDLSKPNKETGRLRNFLLVAMKNFLINEARYKSAQCRSGEGADVALDGFDKPSEWAFPELHDHETPERTYVRQWAISLLEQAAKRLVEEYTRQGKGELIAELMPFLSGEAERGESYKQVAESHNLQEGAVRVSVFRLRKRHRELIQEEILATVETEAEAEEERRFILQTLGNPA